jgi:hypothetical protein
VGSWMEKKGRVGGLKALLHKSKWRSTDRRRKGTRIRLEYSLGLRIGTEFVLGTGIQINWVVESRQNQ